MSCDLLEHADFSRFEREYFARNKPVVLRGLARTHANLKVFGWSAAYFRDVFRDTKVPILETRSGFLSYERDVLQMPFSEFYTRSFGPNRERDVYYYFKNSAQLIPQGHDDSDAIDELAPYLKRAMMRNLWISSTGLTVGLHFDAAENFNFQLRGDKIFTLFPPGVRGFYPLPMFSQTAHISGVFRDGPNPDLTKFPKFDASRAVQVHLHEGDILYLPAYWWHQVESLGEENVNLNFWWMPSARKQVLNWNQALRGYAQLGLRYAKFRNVTKAPAATAVEDMVK